MASSLKRLPSVQIRLRELLSQDLSERDVRHIFQMIIRTNRCAKKSMMLLKAEWAGSYDLADIFLPRIFEEL